MISLNFPSKGTALAGHLKQSPPNSRYLSPQIQNELIELCGNQIRDNIIKETTAYFFPSAIAIQFSDLSLQCK
jgi:hypothetical protein